MKPNLAITSRVVPPSDLFKGIECHLEHLKVYIGVHNYIVD